MNMLEMNHIYKSFGVVKALQDVHLTVGRGEICALMGENGAGKSTLMNVLTGVIEKDSGSIVFDGKEFPNPTIRQMEEAGIAFVHQELNVINDLTVFENIFLKREIRNKYHILDSKKMIAETKQLFSNLGVQIDPTVMVSELKTSEKQLLEICRALHMDAKLLILDEPTTSLSNEEIDHLFGILRKMKAQGKSFIFISHKMPEIFSIADTYTVFRNGQYVSEGKIKDTNPTQMTSDMIGEAYAEKDVYEKRPIGEVLLNVQSLYGEGFRKIDLQLRKGEVLALTGLAGCGASELMHTLFGASPILGGTIEVEGKLLNKGIKSFMRNKVAMLPSNRKENSVIPDLSILENMYSAEHQISSNKQLISLKEELSRYAKQKEALRIKADQPTDPINSLSGGNQQKVFLARWLNTEADILLFDNPTQGVDVGAKAEIYQLIMEFAKEGKAIIINTLEIPEIMKVADRCIVLYDGEIVKEFEHDEINEKDVMLYSTNAINAEGGN
ncbi:MAG: sugar ABC transporter ATP-binding protein [Bacillota bacterium]|nr:sugar ABC transporter ATP-binding protein [Bacillota bacterium]